MEKEHSSTNGVGKMYRNELGFLHYYMFRKRYQRPKMQELK
jgi:hypothetical protein